MTGVKQLVLMGAGGHASVVADAARAAGWTVIGYVDDPAYATRATQHSIARLGDVDDIDAILRNSVEPAVAHAAVGSAHLRRTWLDRVGAERVAAIVHPTAVVSPSARIEPGAFIGPLAVVNAHASVGQGVIVNSGAIIEHDCVLEDYCHVAPRAVLAGNVHVGQESLVGAGAAVRPGIQIGRSATVGLGAVVICDVPDGATAVGNPARWPSPAPRRSAAV